MCSDSIAKRMPLDVIMTRFQDVIGGTGALTNVEWSQIEGVMAFLRIPRQVMESLSADGKSTLDLVPVTVERLLKLCDRGEAGLKLIHQRLTAEGMTRELET
jgi:hypothetical protein